jgi:hypothetical protein
MFLPICYFDVRIRKIFEIRTYLGEAMGPESLGIYDNYRVEKQLIHSSTLITMNLILVDEILCAGLSSLRPDRQLLLFLLFTSRSMCVSVV